MTPKIKFLSLLFLLITSQLYAQEKPKVNYEYLIYTPKNYANSAEKFPLLIYLHGASLRGHDLNKLKTYGLPYQIDKGQEFDFIIASPQCPPGKYWSTENWFENLYTDLLSKYNIDPSRVYCTGISMGGYGTFSVAMDYPDKFAAIVSLCGGVNDGELSRVCPTLGNIPIWAFHGTADTIVPISETEKVVRKLESCNGNIKFTRLKNAGHGIQYVYETEPEIYSWMLRHRK